ncbi:hypothetical protein CSQ87_02745 [Bifidobacterium simiarum]|uniref:DUF4038 domain-containing protein n=2 Tax=Bifidobacterium simiarum TaxID=2045441 RepID=A0A2M9HGQ2_9BIFI|nr:hypothetical protein CSQ87_02745 [Bifidobacterium simiarum]
MRRLKISEDRRYFEYEDGEPFAWLADTAWTLPQRIMWQDVEHYMRLRRAQGFTVAQIVALDPERDVLMRTPSGCPALHDGDLNQPNEEYFAYLDRILEAAERHGLYVLLLPVWGQLVVGDNWMGETFEKTVTEENARGFGEWIGRRYRNRSNVLWCLGGDRQPIHKGVDYRNVWRRLAEGLAKGVLGADLRYDDPDPRWRDLPLTYHACHELETGECSTMSYWTDDEAWISYIMLQSGHGVDARNFDLIAKEYDRARPMPVWDGEPAYEMMPTSWPDFTQFHDSWMVRRRAYWGLLSGAFGHTYGHCSVWSSIGERERDAMFRKTWFEALTDEGAGQMRYLRDAMESLGLGRCRPCRDVLAENPDDLEHHMQAAMSADGEALLVYLPSGGEAILHRTRVSELFCQSPEGLGVLWYSPRNGDRCEGRLIEEDSRLVGVAPTAGRGEDWLLVIAPVDRMPDIVVGDYGEGGEQADGEERRGPAKVFQW